YCVCVPIQLAEHVRSETGSAARRNRDYAHVALPALVNRVRHPIGEAAICGKPIVWGALRTSAYSGHFRVLESLPYHLEVALGNFGVRVHQTDAVIPAHQFECQRCPPNRKSLADVFRISDDIYSKGVNDLSCTIAGTIVNHVYV